MSLFTDGTEENEKWLKTDPSVLNNIAREWKHGRPHTETKEPEEERELRGGGRGVWVQISDSSSTGSTQESTAQDRAAHT
eukprot:6473030-Pyramimonas_sp.AAC.1